MMSGAVPQREPLARLFLSAAGLLVEGLHERLAERGWTEVRHSWGFVIGRLMSGPSTVSDLAAFLGVSKQAASKTVEHMEAHGLVRVSPYPGDGRRKAVELTPDGERFRRDVEAIYAEVEASWAATIGAQTMERIRERLTAAIVAMNDGTLPPPAPLK
jgi:DNA-binding MarR family transcriptional regulator